jgi:hypothetical protein
MGEAEWVAMRPMGPERRGVLEEYVWGVSAGAAAARKERAAMMKAVGKNMMDWMVELCLVGYSVEVEMLMRRSKRNSSSSSSRSWSFAVDEMKSERGVTKRNIYPVSIPHISVYHGLTVPFTDRVIPTIIQSSCLTRPSNPTTSTIATFHPMIYRLPLWRMEEPARRWKITFSVSKTSCLTFPDENATKMPRRHMCRGWHFTLYPNENANAPRKASGSIVSTCVAKDYI